MNWIVGVIVGAIVAILVIGYFYLLFKADYTK